MNLVELPKDIIKQVYVGINVNKGDTDRILELTKSLNPNISVVKMEPPLYQKTSLVCAKTR